jgi:predicted transcriptional regulator of viral defense system
MPSAVTLREAAVRLARQANLAGRWPVILDEDLAGVDEVTGSRQATFGVLRDLTRSRQLEHVRRGAYVMRDETGVLDVDLPRLIDALTPQPYLITAGRALAWHGLSDQHFRKVVVLTPTSRRGFDWRGDHVHYAVTDPPRIWGAHRSRGPRIATQERALLDSLAYRGWGVTLSQNVEALDIALSSRPQFAESLAAAAARYGNAAGARRLGFLVERVAGEAAAAPFRSLLGSSKAATLLDQTRPATGPIDGRWRIRVNADVDALLAHRMVG